MLISQRCPLKGSPSYPSTAKKILGDKKLSINAFHLKGLLLVSPEMGTSRDMGTSTLHLWTGSGPIGTLSFVATFTSMIELKRGFTVSN